jgi:hypothetical protein
MEIGVFTLYVDLKECRDKRILIDEHNQEWILLGISMVWDSNGFPTDGYAETKLEGKNIGASIVGGRLLIGNSENAKLYYSSILASYIKPADKYPTVKCSDCGHTGEAKSYMAPDFFGDKKQRIGTCYYICRECESPNISYGQD